MFYVDKQNTLQELISIDNFTTSEKGTLGSLAKEVVPTAKSLAALYNDGMFYVHNESRAGIRLFYGDVDGQVHEVDYLTSSEKWSPGNFSFEVTNGNGGMALDFIDRGGPGVVHLFVLNDANELRLWYNIFSNTTSTTANPDGRLCPPSAASPLSRKTAAMGCFIISFCLWLVDNMKKC